MKKIAFLLLLGVVSLCSCDVMKPDDPEVEENNRLYLGESMTLAAIRQFICVTDPFNLAFRLNTLMTECENAGLDIADVNNETVANRRLTLFGAASISHADGVFTLILNPYGGKDVRTGTVVISTGGVLLRDGAAWTVSIPEFYTRILPSDNLEVKLAAASYQIVASGENTWQLPISNFSTKATSNEQESSANWSGSITVVQDDAPGDQSLDKISTSTYSCSIISSSGINFIDDPNYGYQMVTTEGKPLRFNPTCGEYQVVGGELTVMLSEYIVEYPTAFSSCSWGDGTTCGTEGSARYYGPM